MTDFVIRGQAKGDQMTLEQINAKFTECIDWTKLRVSGLSLDEVTFDVAPPPERVWSLLAEPGQNSVTAEGCKGIAFVEVYHGTTGEVVYNALAADPHKTNGGDMIITLKDHAEDPWLVRVIEP